MIGMQEVVGTTATLHTELNFRTEDVKKDFLYHTNRKFNGEISHKFFVLFDGVIFNRLSEIVFVGTFNDCVAYIQSNKLIVGKTPTTLSEKHRQILGKFVAQKTSGEKPIVLSGKIVAISEDYMAHHNPTGKGDKAAKMSMAGSGFTQLMAAQGMAAEKIREEKIIREEAYTRKVNALFATLLGKFKKSKKESAIDQLLIMAKNGELKNADLVAFRKYIKSEHPHLIVG